MKKTFLLILSVLCFSSLLTWAQTIDNFNYSGYLSDNGWSIHNGTTYSISTTTGLSYTGYIGSGIGNAALIGNAGGQDVNYTSGIGPYSTNGNTVYLAFLFNASETGTKSGDYFLHLGYRSSTTSFTNHTPKIFARTTSSTVGFGISNTTTVTYTGYSYTVGTTYLVVVKYVINTSGIDQAYMWVFPSGVPVSETVAGTATTSNTITEGQDIINGIALRQGSTSTSASVVVDGIRVAATWADVLFVPAISSASAIGANTFTANWSSVSDASGYYLDVATNESFTSFVTGYNNADMGNVTSATLTGLTAGQTYYYRVRAYNSAGTGTNSATGTASTVSITLGSMEEANLTFTENDAASAITSSTVLACAGVSNLTGAVIQITENYKSSQDTLSFTDADGITGSWNSSTGTLTLSGSSAYANYQTAIRNVKYQNTSESPGASTRKVSFTVYYNTVGSNTVTRNIDVVPVNDIPILGSIESAAITNIAGSSSLLTSAITIADADHTYLKGAVIQISGNYSFGQDSLSFTSQNGITGLWSATSGTMTLSGTAALELYQRAIRSICFKTAASSASPLARTITFTVNDGADNSASVTRNINVDNPPVLSSIEKTSLLYSGTSEAIITESIVLSDYDNTALQSATVKFASYYQSGYDILSFTDSYGITGSWDSSNGALTLTGSSSLENYQAALRSITYKNTSSSPVKLLRTINFTVNDGTANSGTAARIIDPGYTALSLNSMETDTLEYKQGDGEKGVTSSLTINNSNEAQLNSATIQITGNYIKGEDILVCASQNQIVSVWNANEGKIELTWPTSTANYQTTLRNLTYKNVSSSPSALTKTISFTVSDGYNTSNIAERHIKIRAQRAITLAASPSEWGTVSGGGYFFTGDTVTAVSAPATGHTFAGWTENGTVVSTSPIYKFIASVDRTLTAVFTINQYIVEIQTSPSEGGTVSGAGTYNYGSSVTATAAPADGYKFLNWTCGTSVFSTALSYTFTLNNTIILTANFELLPVLTVTPEYITVGSSAGTTAIKVTNTGGGTMNWSAASDIFWLTIENSASGSNNGTVNIKYCNNNSVTRSGTVTITADGVSGSPKTIEIYQKSIVTDVESLTSAIPVNFQLEQNYPNPFNPSTKIRFSLPSESHVVITIYNMLGERIAKIADGDYAAGYYEVNFNAGNLSSGMYMYVISAGNFVQAKKMILTK